MNFHRCWFVLCIVLLRQHIEAIEILVSEGFSVEDYVEEQSETEKLENEIEDFEPIQESLKNVAHWIQVTD